MSPSENVSVNLRDFVEVVPIKRIISGDDLSSARRWIRTSLAQVLGSLIAGVVFVFVFAAFDESDRHVWKFSYVFLGLSVATLWAISDSYEAKLLRDRQRAIVVLDVPKAEMLRLDSAVSSGRVDSVGPVVLAPLVDASGRASSLVAVLGQTVAYVRCCTVEAELPKRCAETLFGEVALNGVTVRIKATVAPSKGTATVGVSVTKPAILRPS